MTKPKKKAPSRLACPKCSSEDGKSPSGSTLSLGNGVIVCWSMRDCLDCGHRWQTVSMPPQPFVGPVTITDRSAYMDRLAYTKNGLRSLLEHLEKLGA